MHDHVEEDWTKLPKPVVFGLRLRLRHTTIARLKVEETYHVIIHDCRMPSLLDARKSSHQAHQHLLHYCSDYSSSLLGGLYSTSADQRGLVLTTLLSGVFIEAMLR